MLAELSSDRVVFGLAFGIPVIVMLFVALGSQPRMRRFAVAVWRLVCDEPSRGFTGPGSQPKEQSALTLFRARSRRASS